MAESFCYITAGTTRLLLRETQLTITTAYDRLLETRRLTNPCVSIWSRGWAIAAAERDRVSSTNSHRWRRGLKAEGRRSASSPRIVKDQRRTELVPSARFLSWPPIREMEVQTTRSTLFAPRRNNAGSDARYLFEWIDSAGGGSFPKPLHVLDKDVAIWTSQTLFGRWTGIRELNISPRRRLKLGPLRHLTT